MTTRGQLTGMAGVYLVAAEMSQRGFIVSPTSRSAHGVDLLVADTEGLRTFAIEVKTNRTTFGFWLLGAKAATLEAPTLFYVLVNIRKTGPEFYIVPSRIVRANVRIDEPTATRKSRWHAIHLDPHVLPYRDNWGAFSGRGVRPRVPVIR